MSSEFQFFVRTTDGVFWEDRERVKTLIELYESHICLWDMKSPEYKNLLKKKKAKEEIGTHFGLSGVMSHCVIYIYTHRKIESEFINNFCPKITFGCNNFDYFSENQQTKFSASWHLHLGI